MKANKTQYFFEDSLKRITNSISSIKSKDEMDGNQFVHTANVSVMTIKYQPSIDGLDLKYAHIVHIFLQEAIKVLSSNQKCTDYYIENNSIWAVFNTEFKSDVDSLITTAARINSLIDVINVKNTSKKSISFQIGMDYGKATSIDIVDNMGNLVNRSWHGTPIIESHNLANGVLQYDENPIVISEIIYNNLNKDNKQYFTRKLLSPYYTGNVVITIMDNWVKKNRL